MNRLVHQATRYVGASGIAFGVDVGLLWFQVSGLGVPYLLAAAISFMAGTVVVYWSSIRHIFDYRRMSDWRHEFAVFAGLGLGGLAVNLVAMYALVSGLGLYYLPAKFVAAGFTFTANFLLRRGILFTPGRAGTDSAPRGTGNSR